MLPAEGGGVAFAAIVAEKADAVNRWLTVVERGVY
jgi:hypothetical protein